MPLGYGQGAVLTPLLTLSPGDFPPVASNHPVLPRVHLPLPGGAAGEHGHPTVPGGPGTCICVGHGAGMGDWQSLWQDLAQCHVMSAGGVPPALHPQSPLTHSPCPST